MPFPERRGDEYTGRWIGEVKKYGRKKAFDSKAQADAYEQAVKDRRGDEPDDTTPEDLGPTYEFVARECIANGGPKQKWFEGKDPSILSRLEFVIGFLGHHPIRSIGDDILMDLMKKLMSMPVMVKGKGGKAGVRRKPRSNKTINEYMNACSSVLTYAAKKKPKPYIDSKPVMPRLEALSVPRDILTPEQEQRILEYVEAHHEAKYGVTFRFLLATGLRSGETGKLKPHQIAEDRVKLLATQTKGKRERTVYADPDQQPHLACMRELIATGQLPRAYRLRRVLEKALVACEYQHLNVVVHSLRHTYCTRLLEDGVPPPIVQKIMGHKSIDTTMRYYHSSEAAAERAIHERWQREKVRVTDRSMQVA